jgi:L-2-hydroxycarboxylate dehydrogenase (NAD+)
VLGHGNERCLLPGQIEAEAGKLSAQHGGLLFTVAELEAFAEIAAGCGVPPWKTAAFKTAEV